MKEYTDAFYIKVIKEFADKIASYVAPFDTIHDALEDDKTYDAVYLRLQQLSETTQRLSPAYKQRHPDIQWGDIAGFRNRMVHGYLGEVNVLTIIEVLEEFLPALISQLTTPTE